MISRIVFVLIACCVLVSSLPTNQRHQHKGSKNHHNRPKHHHNAAKDEDIVIDFSQILEDSSEGPDDIIVFDDVEPSEGPDSIFMSDIFEASEGPDSIFMPMDFFKPGTENVEASEGPDSIFMPMDFFKPGTENVEASEGPDSIFMPMDFFKPGTEDLEPNEGPDSIFMPEIFEASEGPDSIFMPINFFNQDAENVEPSEGPDHIPKHYLQQNTELLKKISNALFDAEVDSTSEVPELVDPTDERSTEAMYLQTSLPTDPIADMGSTCMEMQHPNLSLHCAYWLYNNYHIVNRGWAQCSSHTANYADKCGYWWAKCKKTKKNRHCCISAHCQAKSKYGVNFGK